MTTKPPSRSADQFVLRLPEGMRPKIAELAKSNNRSMNAEIVSRLEESLEPRRAVAIDIEAIETTTLITELVRRFPGELFTMYMGEMRLGASNEADTK